MILLSFKKSLINWVFRNSAEFLNKHQPHIPSWRNYRGETEKASVLTENGERRMERLAPLSWKELNGECNRCRTGKEEIQEVKALPGPGRLHWVCLWSCSTSPKTLNSTKQLPTNVCQRLTAVGCPSPPWHGQSVTLAEDTAASSCWVTAGGRGLWAAAVGVPMQWAGAGALPFAHTLQQGLQLSHHCGAALSGQRAVKLSGCMSICKLSIISPLHPLDTTRMAES